MNGFAFLGFISFAMQVVVLLLQLFFNNHGIFVLIGLCFMCVTLTSFYLSTKLNNNSLGKE